MCDKQLLALSVMYRPPSPNNAYLKSMLDQIDNVFNEIILLMGDLNYDYNLDESLSPNRLHQNEILYGMRQLINSPTRVTLTTSTLIDVMFSTEHESHIVTGVYKISLSDHYMTYTIHSKLARKTCLHKEIMFRNYKRFNVDSFRNALSPNDGIYNTSWSADQLVDKWNDVKRKAIKYKSEETWLLYRHARNNVTEMIQCSKIQYNENNIQESRNHPTKMWKVLEQLTHGNNSGAARHGWLTQTHRIAIRRQRCVCTSLFVTSSNLRRCFWQCGSIVVKLKQHVLFDPRQKNHFHHHIESPPNTLTADIFNSYFTMI